MSRLEWCFLGRVGYDDARRLQEHLAAERVAGTIGDRLLLLEHPPVVTLGRHAPDPFAAVARGDAPLPPVPVRVGRGGGATYHGPGQLVAYPVVALRSGGRGVRRFVAALEESLCDVARLSGVAAVRRAGLPGAWAPGESPRKLGSVGIGVRRGVTLHGAALNLARSSVDGFRGFDPCGLAGVVATSVDIEPDEMIGWICFLKRPSSSMWGKILVAQPQPRPFSAFSLSGGLPAASHSQPSGSCRRVSW